MDYPMPSREISLPQDKHRDLQSHEWWHCNKTVCKVFIYIYCEKGRWIRKRKKEREKKEGCVYV
jgi:hypothetical protein